MTAPKYRFEGSELPSFVTKRPISNKLFRVVQRFKVTATILLLAPAGFPQQPSSTMSANHQHHTSSSPISSEPDPTKVSQPLTGITEVMRVQYRCSPSEAKASKSCSTSVSKSEFDGLVNALD